jgi:hypothetical protein
MDTGRTSRGFSGPNPERGAGPPLISVGTIIIEAAPRFAIFEAWAPRTSTACSLVTYTAPGIVLLISNAEPPPSLLRRRIPALHHYELLPAAPSARQPPESRLASPGPGAGSGTLAAPPGRTNASVPTRASWPFVHCASIDLLPPITRRYRGNESP